VAKPVAAAEPAPKVASQSPATTTSGNPTCAEQATQLGVSLATHNCLKITASGNFEVARRCESSYYQVTTSRPFRVGDEILVESKAYSSQLAGDGGADVICVRGLAGTWAFATDNVERFVIMDRYDRSAVWCEGGQGC
jgi:hypothetical protein